ncbi:hypothetical protein NDI54_05920 [Haloarcula sp. S1AR25-5A]|uniref:Uncharacterized protein n=1 Tax=Haloarcula terrestris TaxID=2950533 RepID=A0AAE4EY63_9EURY|nr:hypothetical protein [Haloarcula terrestris]MDS0220891.1 hypothetical protein [Haloarcula terrestris]
MTRRSKRELERAVDDLDGEDGSYGLQDLFWASLKDYYDGSLTPGERRLLKAPEEQLSPAAKTHAETLEFENMEAGDA